MSALTPRAIKRLLGLNDDLYPAELNVLDDVTAGTAAASSAVVLDANKDITGLRNVTLTGLLTTADLTISDIGTIAAAGSVQGDATAIANTISVVTGADGTKGVILPAATAGLVYIVYSSTATNGLKIYPASGDDINDGSADAAITIEGKTAAIFIAVDTATWTAIYTANS